MKLKTLLLALLPLAASATEPPTMGWSSWNTYRVNISDSLICRQADAMKRLGLDRVGYRYINIDDGFFGGRAADGTLRIHPTRFPHGLEPVVRHIHRLGFRAGIYSDAGRNTCGNYWDADTIARGVGLYGHDSLDADFYFRRLGFDFIKVDFCGGDAAQNSERLQLDERERYTAIRHAVDRAAGRRDVRINICRWAFPGTWVSRVGSSWRIAADIAPNWAAIKRIIAANRYLSAYAADGAFNDMDMLEIGRGLTEAEERTHFGMWCMQCSPLLIGCDLTALSPASLALITNRELIALDQQAPLQQARPVREEGGVWLYVKDVERLNGRTRAVAIYNSTDADRTFTLRLSDVDLAGRTRVRDLFTHTDLPDVQDTLAVSVPAHDTRIFRLRGGRRTERTLYEAETAWLEGYQNIGLNPRLGHAIPVPSAGCSGGAKVCWAGGGDGNRMEWRDVYTRGGTYRLTLRYLAPAEAEPTHAEAAQGAEAAHATPVKATQTASAEATLTVNGEPIPLHLSVPAPGEAAEHTLTVRLKKGRNVLCLSSDSAFLPDIDCLRLAR